jgi:hypothetical protein
VRVAAQLLQAARAAARAAARVVARAPQPCGPLEPAQRLLARARQ